MTTYCYPYKRGTGWRSQGFRSNPNSGANGPGGHTGFDQAMDAGTPIYAPGDGIIRNSSWVTENYLENPWWLTQMGGDILVIDCFGPDGTTANGPTFVIAHLFDSTAPVGKRVKKGEKIGISGSSGTASTGPHAHIEALPPNWDFNNGVYGRVNPELYFTEWPDELGTITTQSADIAQALENIVATLNDAEKKKLMTAVDRILSYVDAPVSKVDEAVLDAKVTRAVVGGETTLRATLAHLDNNLNKVTDAAKPKP